MQNLKTKQIIEEPNSEENFIEEHETFKFQQGTGDGPF